jgi:plasmid stabilization system protein ParE
MRVRYTPRARSDLRSILQYIDERSPQGARSARAFGVSERTGLLVERLPEVECTKQ